MSADATIAQFGLDELEGVAADIGAALDRLEAVHDWRLVLAALQLAAFRRIAAHVVDGPLLDALVELAGWQFDRGAGAVKGRA